MSDFAGQESTEEVSEPQSTEIEAPEQDHSTGDTPNPFWGDVEKLTGPNVFRTIQPHLARADAEASKRISAVNQSYAPWKALADQEITPEQATQAIGIVRQLNDPAGQVQIFQSLQNFLRENGRLPDQAELKEQVEEDTDDEQTEDPRLAQLAQQNEAIVKFLRDQQLSSQRQAAAKEADSWLEAETTKLADPKYGFDAQDIKEIVRIAAFTSQQTGKDPDSLDAAAQQYAAMRDRIRTTPRPGQLAPRLPSGPGGGTPQSGAIDPHALSKDQRRELVAAMLQRGKQQ